ncbi:hypothetical protein FOPG_06244 [Fusarium oxysporum f. sp. conglutinans race 2 54008]|uniref:Uncharacterized protein n=2 Tax=Fusarium oxysporum TaxID=5507 RepID=X0J4A5_FUSOX|nr:hypothetical protein FOVG_03135 [Fusarium oxysporum f. sp. pisi HDV247]EXL80019.1 hypothetical protein FOPG_06244 [Fusarium oxysporum f. sp. conglutinans race 2 54008]
MAPSDTNNRATKPPASGSSSGDADLAQAYRDLARYTIPKFNVILQFISHSLSHDLSFPSTVFPLSHFCFTHSPCHHLPSNHLNCFRPTFWSDPACNEKLLGL